MTLKVDFIEIGESFTKFTKTLKNLKCKQKFFEQVESYRLPMYF